MAYNSGAKLQDQMDKLKRQNDMLKNQLELRKENSDLKTANILAQILSMMERLQSSSDVRIKTSDTETSTRAPEVASCTAAKIAESPRGAPTPKVKLAFSDECKCCCSPAGAGPCSDRGQQSCCTPCRPQQRPGPVHGALKTTDLSAPSTSSRPPSYRSTPPTPPSYTGRMQSSPYNSDGPPVLRSLGLSSVQEDSFLGKEEQSANISSDNVLPITPRLIGEIAFQLDRRLLSYIFNGHSNSTNVRRRFYGFTIQNIGEMIDLECTKNQTVDEQAKLAMSYRYQYIFSRMKMLGYDLKYHPMFSIKMVNQYGLLNVSGQGMGQSLQLQDPDILQAIIGKIADKEYLKDILILLDCLVFLSHDEGRPLFIY